MSNSREIAVTSKNVWFLEKSIPLFGMLDFFPSDVVVQAGPSTGSANRKLTVETDQGWSFETQILAGSFILRNHSVSKGTGRWVKEASLEPGDKIVIERLSEYEYRLSKRGADEHPADA